MNSRIHLQACEAVSELQKKHPEIASSDMISIHNAIFDALDRQEQAIKGQFDELLAPLGMAVSFGEAEQRKAG